MNCFSNDVDLLRYEPKLFTEFYFPSQVLASGTGGTLTGTMFTKSGVDFVAAGISAGGVIYLKSAAGTLDGVFEIVSVDSATQLTVSVLRSEETAVAVCPPAGTDVTYRVATFAPQASEAELMLMRCFGMQADDTENCIESEELRVASVFAILASVYVTLTGDAETSEELWKKSLHYRTLFEHAREILRLDVDTDGDGASDEVKQGGSIRLVRE
ncbi:MAG: hypothetical protein Q7T18_01350 [Sedimentisphaerales bacterium]|nr:hypothetical protein [Sedimentisphaerales bacterium]